MEEFIDKPVGKDPDTSEYVTIPESSVPATVVENAEFFVYVPMLPEDVDHAGGLSFTNILNDLSATFCPSDARTVKLNVVFEVMLLIVPEITPVELFIESPPGNAPDDIEYDKATDSGSVTVSGILTESSSVYVPKLPEAGFDQIGV